MSSNIQKSDPLAEEEEKEEVNSMKVELIDDGEPVMEQKTEINTEQAAESQSQSQSFNNEWSIARVRKRKRRYIPSGSKFECYICHDQESRSMRKLQTHLKLHQIIIYDAVCMR